MRYTNWRTAKRRALLPPFGAKTHREQHLESISQPFEMLLRLQLLALAARACGLGGGPVKCDVVSSCGAGATCCPTTSGQAGEWGCCGAPNATCCPDMLHCCPPGFPVCGAGTCAAAPGGATVPWLARLSGAAEAQPRDDLGLGLGLGRPPPPIPPPPLYPFECTATKMGCFAEVGHADGWDNRTVNARNTPNGPMEWGTAMSVTACARFCYQGMNLVDWSAGASPFTAALAGNRLCACSTGVPPTKNGLPKRVDDSLCDAPCPANSTEICGDENQTVASAYAFTCSARPAALAQPICNLNFSQWWNGSVVSYKQYIDCFAKSDTAYDSLYVNDHFAIQVRFCTVLCCF